MMTDPTKITDEEIAQYRELLRDNSKALEDLDLIERCGGDLEYATLRLARRAGMGEVRRGEKSIWQQAVEKARNIACPDDIRNGFAPNLLGGLIGLFVSCGDPLLTVVATSVAIHIVQVSLEEFCSFSE